MHPYIHEVHYYETDKMGITHHSNYIRWMEEARVAFLDEAGWGYDKLEELGLASPVIAVYGTYHRPTKFREAIAITVHLKEYKGARLVLEYEMYRHTTGELVFSGTSEHCFVNRDGRPLRLKRACPAFDAALLGLLQQS